MTKEELVDFLRNHLEIRITRFDSSFLDLEVRIEGEIIDGCQIDVPSYEIVQSQEKC